MKIKLKTLRNIIREEIGRNYHSLDTDPFTWKDYKDIDVHVYANQHNGFDVEVKCHKMPSLNTGIKTFSDESTANHWARMNAERMNRILLNKI